MVQKKHFDVCANRHGLAHRVDNGEIWVAGESSIISISINCVHETRVLRGIYVTENRRDIDGPKNLRFPSALDLSGSWSVARVLRIHGYEVVTVDQEARWGPEKCVRIANWDYKKDFQPGEFTLVVVHPSRQHDFTVAKKVLEIIQYLRPDRWWMTSVPQNKKVNEEMF